MDNIQQAADRWGTTVQHTERAELFFQQIRIATLLGRQTLSLPESLYRAQVWVKLK